MDTEIYLRSKDTTDPRYGHVPEERPIPELIESGMVNLDKPRGPTSHQAVAWLRDILDVKKAGHGGTLDPKVSGVLPVAIERATRVMKFLQKRDKTYVTVMTLHGDVSDEDLDRVLSDFRGTIVQVPPVRSAVKREPRNREIKDLEMLERDGRDVLFRVTCEAGTYIRKLCRDMGEALLVGANMSELRRTRSGFFDEGDACRLQDLVDAMHYYREEGDEEAIRGLISPVERYMRDLPKVWARDTAVEALCNGASLALPGVVKCENTVSVGSTVAVLTLKDELIGVGKSEMSAKQIFEGDSGIAVDLSRVVLPRGTYPRYWKS